MSNYSDIFIDNDKPEMIADPWGDVVSTNSSPTVNASYSRQTNIAKPAYSDKPIPGPIVPSYKYDNIPNPVPNTYTKTNCPCPPPCPPPGPEYDCYVTRHELNRILAHIADADIYRDMSTTGTTCSVGGVKKGTKLTKTTFAQLVDMMLYPDAEVSDMDYACETATGRTVLNSTVTHPYGNFSMGDSLKGMTISQIIEALLCDKNMYGTYKWKSEIITVNAGTEMIDATVNFPSLVNDFDWKNTYVMLVLGKSDTAESAYVYDQIIAMQYNKDQKTNVDISGVPTDLLWSYNSNTKKISLNTASSITTAFKMVLLRR